MSFLPGVPASQPVAADRLTPVSQGAKPAEAKLKANGPSDPKFEIPQSPKEEVKAPAVVLAGGSLSSALAQAESALKTITPPKVENPTGEQVAQAASLRQVADWAQAQISLEKSQDLQRNSQASSLNTRV